MRVEEVARSLKEVHIFQFPDVISAKPQNHQAVNLQARADFLEERKENKICHRVSNVPLLLYSNEQRRMKCQTI
jgi:hypothetical protein